jgi:hypothetical protein
MRRDPAGFGQQKRLAAQTIRRPARPARRAGTACRRGPELHLSSVVRDDQDLTSERMVAIAASIVTARAPGARIYRGQRGVVLGWLPASLGLALHLPDSHPAGKLQLADRAKAKRR